MGFSGRFEAIKAPTTGKARKGTPPHISPRTPHTLASLALGPTYKDETASTTTAKNMATESPPSNHASHAKTRVLILPTPRPRFLAPLASRPHSTVRTSQNPVMAKFAEYSFPALR